MSTSSDTDANGCRSAQQRPNGTQRLSDDLAEPSKSPPKQSIAQRAETAWAKTGIDWRMAKAMFKGALAPTIAVALYQADSYALEFGSLGYLIGIASILSVVIRPRAVFLQTMLFNVLLACLTTAVVILALFCCVKARQNSSAGTSSVAATSGVAASNVMTTGYNSDASAVAGVWLFVLVYGLAVFRAKRPQFMVPAIVGSIIANVGMVYAPQMASMPAALTFARGLLTAILTGFAIATGVSLLIFPTTSRTVIFDDLTKYIASIRGALRADIEYVRSLEEVDMFTAKRTETARHRLERSAEAEAVKSRMQSLTAINAKFHADLPFAKREVAFGNLGPEGLQELARHLRMITVPLVGFSCLSDIFERAAESRDWGEPTGIESIAQSKLHAVEEWHELLRLVRGPFRGISEMIDQGLEHALILLHLAPKARKDGSTQDTEAQTTTPRPGGERFLEHFSAQTHVFHEERKKMLLGWCRMHGVDLPPDFFSKNSSEKVSDPEWFNQDFESGERRSMRRQLYILLYMEFLLWSIARRTRELIAFVESLNASGKLGKQHLIVPGSKRMIKWCRSWFQSTEESRGQHHTEGNDGLPTLQYGEAFQKRKDPMHLPPVNAWERLGNRIRKISHFLRSPESVFGFRVAVATMSVAVVAYLQHTQIFYTQQRIFWAQVMISIGMQPSAGQSLRTSLFRIVGTAVFMLVSWVCWYIVDGQTAGVLVFYFAFLTVGPWIMLKYPAYTTLGMIGPITMTLIVGYELQVLKIGVAQAESNGQLYYPPYELGPIRLATVLGGLFLGWLWTIFPYPVSEHKEQKDSLGSSLYLLASYYSVMHETVRARLRGLDADPAIKASLGEKLDKARRSIYAKCNLLISGLRARAAFIKFDIPVGGKFPQRQYEDITELLQSSLNFMALVSYASTAFNDMLEGDDAESTSEWVWHFRELMGDANVTSRSITTLLSLMASSVKNGQPLPPYLQVPEPFQLSKRLDELDRDILSVRHIAEPGYSSFAVIQIGTKCIIDDLNKLLTAVRKLVGELDFSLDVVRAAEAGEDGDEKLTFSTSKQSSAASPSRD